jgi:hypothetical protein
LVEVHDPDELREVEPELVTVSVTETDFSEDEP